MASTKTEKVEGPDPVASGRTAPKRRESASMPGAPGQPAGRSERKKLRDLLGDYAEQTGAFFG